MKLSFSLPCEIFCFKPVFGACLYAVFHSRSLHSYMQTQKKVDLDLPLQCLYHYSATVTLKVRSQMTRYSMIQTIYTFPGFKVRPCINTRPCVYARPHVFIITAFVPLQCNIDVTSLKVRSQITIFSMIQTIYTFPGFNTRPRVKFH